TELAVPEGVGTLEVPLPAPDVPVAALEWTVALPPGTTGKLASADYADGPLASRPGAGAGEAAAGLAEAGAGDLARRAREALAESARKKPAEAALAVEAAYASAELALTVEADGARLATTLEAVSLVDGKRSLPLPDLGAIYQTDVVAGEADVVRDAGGQRLR